MLVMLLKYNCFYGINRNIAALHILSIYPLSNYKIVIRNYVFDYQEYILFVFMKKKYGKFACRLFDLFFITLHFNQK